GVAGNLATAAAQVARPGQLDAGQEPQKCVTNVLQNEPVGAGNLTESRRTFVSEHDAETEAAFAEQHRPTAAGAPQNGHAIALTGRLIDIFRQPASRPEHDGELRPFPEPQDFIAPVRLSSEEQ